MNIYNILHDQFLYNIIFDMVFDLHCACLRSCMGLGTSAWIFAYPFIQPFCLPFDVFSFALCIRLGLPHPLAFNVTLHMWRPLNVLRTHFSGCSHGGEWSSSHDVIRNAFAYIVKKKVSFLHEKTHVIPPPPCPLPFNIIVNELTLYFQLMAFAPWWTWSFFIPPK
jgi:hypothetical protein